MKLASLKGGRDGRLIIVSRDLSRHVPVPEVAPTLQAALDDWAACAPRLKAVSDALNAGARADAQPFVAADCAAPLPRAYQWADGSAYLHHVELVRKARGAEMPPSFWTDPLMYQGGSDTMLGPRDPIEAESEDQGIDLEAEIAVITLDVPRGAREAEGEAGIALVTLVNDVSLRNLIPGELAKGFGFFHAKPSTAFAPVAATLDEVEGLWREGRLHRPLEITINGARLGSPDAGTDMQFSFPQLIAHAAKTRALGAGTIIGSGTVSNRDPAAGSACLAEVRMIETIERGAPRTPFLAFGDTVRIDLRDAAGRSIFGAIEQTVIRR